MRVRFSAAAALTAATTLLAAGPASAQGANPCRSPEAKRLPCPNLRIGPPIDLYLEHASGGRLRLRATSDVRSRGRGPMEPHGRRDGTRRMAVRQRIYRAGGGHVEVPADYDKQWINVSDLHGCFVFTMTGDPKHLLYESNERDNTSRRLVRLPFTGDDGC